MTPEEQAMLILTRLECGRERCVCHTATRRGWGVTHATWRGDEQPSLSVTVYADRVLVCDFGRRDQEDTIAQLSALGLWHGPSGHPRIRVARMPKGAKDVADLLAQGRAAEYQQMIAEAQPTVAWMVDHPPRADSPQYGLMGKRLAELDEVSRESYIRLLAERQDVPVEIIREELTDYLRALTSGSNAQVIRVDL